MLGNDGQEWQLEYIQIFRWILNLIGKEKGQSQFNLYPDDTSSSESGLFKKRIGSCNKNPRKTDVFLSSF